MGMVASQFGGMAIVETIRNWLPILGLLVPLGGGGALRRRLLPEGRAPGRTVLSWLAGAALSQLLSPCWCSLT